MARSKAAYSLVAVLERGECDRHVHASFHGWHRREQQAWAVVLATARPNPRRSAARHPVAADIHQDFEAASLALSLTAEAH